MSQPKDTWTDTHDLALIYVALAYGTDYDLSGDELRTVTRCLEMWDDGLDAEAAQELVLEAMAVYLEEDEEEKAGAEVLRSIHALAASLSEEARRRALEDLVRIAEADGVLLSSERSLIGALAEAWRLKPAAEALLSQTTAEVEALPSWSLLHDIGLVYLVVAHSTDGELSDAEIAAIIERARAWKPEMSEEEIREVLRGVLAFYAQQPSEEALARSVGAIKETLPMIQRLIVLDDLHYIAHADGAFNDHERTMIGQLAQAWGASAIRTNGYAG